MRYVQKRKQYLVHLMPPALPSAGGTLMSPSLHPSTPPTHTPIHIPEQTLGAMPVPAKGPHADLMVSAPEAQKMG